jgi:hypothetical protein
LFLGLISVGGDPAMIPPRRPGHFSFGAFVGDPLDKRDRLAVSARGEARSPVRHRAHGVASGDTRFQRALQRPV